MKKYFAYMLLLFIGASISVPSYSDIIFTAPPRETAEQGRKVYGPIAAYLTKLLKKKVVYKHPGNWLAYQFDMRKDKYDIVFDAAHFVSWRIKKLGARPIARLPGHSNFYILADKNNDKIKIAADLVGKKICGIGPPNLGTLTVYEQFLNPMRQPVIYLIKGGFVKSFKTFKTGVCEAVVLRANVYENKLTEADRAGVKTIVESPWIPNQGLTASKRISEAELEKMTESLTQSPEGIEASQKLLARFAKGQKSFIPTSKKEFEGPSKYLEGVIFGW